MSKDAYGNDHDKKNKHKKMEKKVYVFPCNFI